MKSNKIGFVWAILRISMGWIFLWSFLDKVFGLGYATDSSKSWLTGVSPTLGFLKFGTTGPIAPFYQSIAGNTVVDWLFMTGLLLVGVSLILGIGIKVAGYGGSLMMLLIWSASFPPEHNPFLDEHVVYILVLIILAESKSGYVLGLGKWWSNTRIVKKYKFLE